MMQKVQAGPWGPMVSSTSIVDMTKAPLKKRIDHLGQGRNRSLVATSFEFTVQSFVIYRYRRMLPDVWAAHAKSRNGQIVSVEHRHFYRVASSVSTVTRSSKLFEAATPILRSTPSHIAHH